MSNKIPSMYNLKTTRQRGRIEHLSNRELEVLVWTAEGKTCVEISMLLSLSINTVKTHIKNACKKMNAVSKTHAIAIAAANNNPLTLKLLENKK